MGGAVLQIFNTVRRRRPAAIWVALWIGGTTLLGGCSWLHFGTPDEDTYDYRKSKPRQQPLEVPPDLSQLPKDDRYVLPGGAPAAKPASGAAAANGTEAAAATTAGVTPVVNAGVAAQLAPAGLTVAPAEPNARIVREGNARWLAVQVTPELAYATVKDLWVSLGYKIAKDEPSVGIIETDWSEAHPEINEDVLRNSLHKALGAFDSNGERTQFRARIERTAANTSEITITERGMVEILTGPFHETSKWQASPSNPELEAEMLQRLALRFGPVQPLGVAVAASGETKATMATTGAGATSGPARVHKVARNGSMTLQVEDTLDRTWRQVGVALDRGSFTIEERRRDKNVYAVRYLDPDYEAREREKKSWWDRIFNSDAKIPEQQFLIALTADGALTTIEVQDKDGRADSSSTGLRIIDQLMEQLR